MKIIYKNEKYTPVVGKGTCRTCKSTVEAEEIECKQEGSGALGWHWETIEKCPVCKLSRIKIRF